MFMESLDAVSFVCRPATRVSICLFMKNEGMENFEGMTVPKFSKFTVYNFALSPLLGNRYADLSRKKF